MTTREWQPMDGADTTLFLCGDVMTGRGIDQILPYPCDPVLYESYMESALGYVELAEQRSGKVPRPVDFEYIWGDALAVWRRRIPDARIVNLETAVTRAGRWEPKGINYRMHPDNAGCLAAAAIDCCVLANNHVLDWGVEGLTETLAVLGGITAVAGAGADAAAAAAPAVLQVPGRRVLVFAGGTVSSGIPATWAATGSRPGVNFLPDLSEATAEQLCRQIESCRRDRDIVVLSIHWGGNWGYEVPAGHRHFAHWLIDAGLVDVVHGHSSHHPMGIEVYRGKPVIYGCGDFINDYEGISGYEQYRGDLSLMYFVRFDGDGALARFDMTPMQVRRLRLRTVATADADWLSRRLSRECGKLGTGVVMAPDNTLVLRW